MAIVGYTGDATGVMAERRPNQLAVVIDDGTSIRPGFVSVVRLVQNGTNDALVTTIREVSAEAYLLDLGQLDLGQDTWAPGVYMFAVSAFGGNSPDSTLVTAIIDANLTRVPVATSDPLGDG